MFRELPRFVGESWHRTDELMARYLGSDIPLLDKTNRTLVGNTGKKLRPMLCLLSALAAGGRINGDTEHFAAAMELLHNATLLHDDVVDASPLRRGKPTVYSLLGGSASVLIGDFWLVKSLECILDSERETERVLRLFSWTLSCLSAGEVLQLQMALSGETTEKEYLRIIHDKTAALFEVAALSGAISAGAPEPVETALREYTRILGLAFQIRDDILDYTAGDELGKPVGHDLLEQKITLPLLEALTSATEEEEKEVRRRVTAIADHPEYRKEIVAFVTVKEGVKRAKQRLHGFLTDAKAALAPLPESESKQWLVKLADSLEML